MSENTIGEQETKALAPQLRTLAVGPICAISRWQRLKDDSGRGYCRITVLGDPPGPASSPPKVTGYVLDGGNPEAGYPLAKDEARRCVAGLEVGDRVELVGNVAPERAGARRQEIFITQEVKKKGPASASVVRTPGGGPDHRGASAGWKTPSRAPVRQEDAESGPARRTGNEAARVVLFSGSRHWKDRQRVIRDLRALPQGSLVIEGGAPGLDTIVRKEAPKLGLHVATVPALWELLDKPAGYRRNEVMAMLQPDELLAYPLGESPGTRHMIGIAERECIQVREAA
jgi:hypothetical protein